MSAMPITEGGLRSDLRQIAAWVDPRSTVLDLGCGDGALLAHLRDAKGCRGYGVEIADDNVLEATRLRVNVIQADLESGLRMFDDDRFDTVVLSQTLQAMHRSEDILREMARVGRQGIVSFPNFGHWRHAVSLLAGRMPVTPEIPYQWYDTPNIHLCTVADFDAFCAAHAFHVLERVVLHDARRVMLLPNLLGSLAIYRFQRS